MEQVLGRSTVTGKAVTRRPLRVQLETNQLLTHFIPFSSGRNSPHAPREKGSCLAKSALSHFSRPHFSLPESISHGVL